MDHIPAEIHIRIGQFLDGPSLLSSLLVSRLWYNTLGHLVWESITKFQWHHNQFPLRFHARSYDTLQPELLHVKHIEWHTNHALTSRWPRYLRAERRKLIPKKQLPLLKLAQLLLLTPNLSSFTFRMHQPVTERAFLPALAQLPNLRRLHIDALNFPRDISNIEDLIPLFSRLDELTLDQASIGLNADRHKGPLSSGESAWTMRSLNILRYYLPLLRYCPELKELELSSSQGGLYYIKSPPFSILPLKMCPKLEKIRLIHYTVTRELEDVVETLTSMKELKSLAFHVLSMEHIDFLCTADVHADKPSILDQNSRIADHTGGSVAETTAASAGSVASTSSSTRNEELAIPLLENLEILSVVIMERDTVLRKLHESFLNILQNRRKLKSLIVFRSLNPVEIFPRPGLELRQGWGCINLESLSLRLQWTTNMTDEERLVEWRQIYWQLGQLTKLRKLSLSCMYIKKGDGSGIHELAGACNLRSLTFTDGGSLPTWMRGEFHNLILATPKLTYLNLGPLTIPKTLIRQWLVEEGRSEIQYC